MSISLKRRTRIHWRNTAKHFPKKPKSRNPLPNGSKGYNFTLRMQLITTITSTIYGLQSWICKSNFFADTFDLHNDYARKTAQNYEFFFSGSEQKTNKSYRIRDQWNHYALGFFTWQGLGIGFWLHKSHYNLSRSHNVINFLTPQW